MKLKILVLIVGLQVAWVLGTALMQESKLSHGTEILLETRPVDPRDLLRGDYVILNYKISEVNWQNFSPPLTRHLPAGKTVYVTLESRGEFYEVTEASLSKPPINNRQVILHGRCQNHTWGSSLSERLEYGLERYFVAEGTGNPTGKVTVQVAVPNSGNGVIKQVFVEGIPYAEALKKQKP